MDHSLHEEVVDFAQQKLESGAKETQDKAGGAQNASVVSAQVVVPSKLGKEAEEVSIDLLSEMEFRSS